MHLAVDSKEAPFIPTEIHLITTLEGVNRAKLQLLHLGTGKFHQLCLDYQLNNIVFTASHVHIIQDAQGQELDDIVTPEQNECAANFITGIVHHLTEDNNTALHVSIAGGRITMGYFLGYALTLLGRPQDRLSHVLVDKQYENTSDFFYPTKESHVIYNRNGDPVDTKDAKVTLAEIPFVSLRYKMPVQILEKQLEFSKAIEYASIFDIKPSININYTKRCLSINNKKIPLSYVNYIFYLWLTQQMIAHGQPIKRLTDGDPAYAGSFLKLYRRYQPKPNDEDPTIIKLKNEGMAAQWIAERVSIINKTLEDSLGQYAKDLYCIEMRGRNREKECLLPESSLQVQFE